MATNPLTPTNSTTSLSNGASPTGSAIKIKMSAFSHSIKEHASLHLSDCERELEILRAREARRLRNHPVCRFLRRRVDGLEVGVWRVCGVVGRFVSGRGRERGSGGNVRVEPEPELEFYTLADGNSSTTLVHD